MVIYGALTANSILAMKQDLCGTCHVMGTHLIVRRVRWVEIFFIPIVPIWINHRLVCGNCGAEQKLGFRQVRRALREAKLPLPHREHYKAFADQLWDAGERRPAESEWDPIVRNPNPGGWNTFLKAWPLIIVIGLVALFVLPQVFDGSPATTGPVPSIVQSDHECWLYADGSIAGCRMHDGTIVGEPIGSPTTCFFLEPLPTGDVDIRCRG